MEGLSEQMTFQFKPTRKGEIGQSKHQMKKFENRGNNKNKALQNVKATKRSLFSWKCKNTLNLESTNNSKPVKVLMTLPNFFKHMNDYL